MIRTCSGRITVQRHGSPHDLDVRGPIRRGGHGLQSITNRRSKVFTHIDDRALALHFNFESSINSVFSFLPHLHETRIVEDDPGPAQVIELVEKNTESLRR